MKRGATKKMSSAIAAKAEKAKALAEKIRDAKVIALIDLTSLPDRFLQSARKNLRGKAEFLKAKKTVLVRALQAAGNAPQLLERIGPSPMLVLTNELTPYSIFQFFVKSKGKVAAEPGQVATFDIIVPEGETNLPPGPALSELKGAGINAQIKAGKIVIAKDSVVAKMGTKISGNVAKVLQKLDILPFEAGINMLCAFDSGLLYNADVLSIDERYVRDGILSCAQQALNLSLNASYPTQANIELLLQQSVRQSMNLALNAKVISSQTIEPLLVQAMREAGMLEGLKPKETEVKKE